MVLKRIGPLSPAKITGILYAVLGLFMGFIISAVALFGALLGSALSNSSEPFVGLIFGAGAIIVMPILYGVMGFISGIITAGIYNFVVRFTGGLELEFEGEGTAAERS